VLRKSIKTLLSALEGGGGGGRQQSFSSKAD